MPQAKRDPALKPEISMSQYHEAMRILPQYIRNLPRNIEEGREAGHSGLEFRLPVPPGTGRALAHILLHIWFSPEDRNLNLVSHASYDPGNQRVFVRLTSTVRDHLLTKSDFDAFIGITSPFHDAIQAGNHETGPFSYSR